MSTNNPQSGAMTHPLAPTTSTIDRASLLKGLNPAQRKAVEHEPHIPLQILAGPGSGKTKVLISRIAYLILVHSIDPTSICAVTFTNKAATEMRERLTRLIGKEKTTALKMGTFHSLCARFLRKYYHAVKLEENFTICDAEETKKLIAALIKPYKEYLISHNIIFTEGAASSSISRAKAKGQSAKAFFREMEQKEHQRKLQAGWRASEPSNPELESKSVDRIVGEIYTGYDQVLKDNNALDFDDLLVYGVKLFTEHYETALWCKHILVDEFQDTNTMQYELMKAIGIRKFVTIVGDPDQSIYGWRSAEVINLTRMREDFPNTQQILLEQNYRSTASILTSCLAIVAEDKSRIPKSLHTSHPLGATPVLHESEDEKQEAEFIAQEIKRSVANMGGVLRWGDFVVLLRFNALSRPIESALQKEGIPCRILGGHKFFERMEIKDLLAYLQLVDNVSYNPAFIRAVKVPSRGTGDKTLAEIATQAEKFKISQLELVEKIHDNKISDIKPPIKRKLASFVQAIRKLRSLDKDDTQPSELIRKLLDLINYEAHLRKTQPDWDTRWENVKELITFASEVEGAPASVQEPAAGLANESHENVTVGKDSLLRQFLQASSLSSEGDNQTEEESKDKVTLSTCHAAKGLEWPVVMIPSVDQGTFPFYRSEDIEEERRLLYVACTRAQSLLYVLYSRKRQVAGQTKSKTLSEFISAVCEKDDRLFGYDIPRFSPEDRAVIAQVLSRPIPDEEEVQRRISELESAGDKVRPVYRQANGSFCTVSLTGERNALKSPLSSSAIYADGHALATISMTFMKDYKKPPFSKSRRANPAVKPLSSALTSPATAPGTYVNPFQSRTLSCSSSLPTPSMPQIPEHSKYPGSASSASSQNSPPRGRSAASSLSKFSSVSHLQKNVRITSLDVPRLRPNSYSNEVAAKPIIYDQNHPPGEPSSLLSFAGTQPTVKPSPMQQDTNQNVDYNMALATLGAPSTRISSELPTGSHHDRPCVVSDLPTATSTPSWPSISQSSKLQTNGPTVSLPTPGVKRRLGMGRTTGGYSNKKFKPPT